ncbi:thioredoxin family protein [Infirmifilum lucidum]|uniref:Thioredoxin family protein n=1 Tax=Infirmifilum lucidum TaxID=2776706 RepID=A0A7L9FIX4_9CREN|nr:thioredoxin family protein [Infirmifilum lucidum]QOJ79591.1 thioredoxin family protein [Infirmifilum lucidum]
MVKEIKVFLPRDHRAQEMLDAFKAELNAIPRGERPKLMVRLLSLKDPSKFEEWLQSLEEVFGGIYVAEFKKYGIRAVPAVVVDGEKAVEGRYLNRQEIRLLVQGLSPELASIAPLEAQPEERLPQAEAPRREIGASQAVKPVAPQPREPAEAPPPIELAPVEVPVEQEPRPVQPAKPQAKSLLQPQQARPRPPQQAPQYPKPLPGTQRLEQKQQVKPEPQQAREPQPQPVAQQPPAQARELAGTCFTCLFYDQARSRCKLLHVVVPDPHNPPCGRRRPR